MSVPTEGPWDHGLYFLRNGSAEATYANNGMLRPTSVKAALDLIKGAADSAQETVANLSGSAQTLPYGTNPTVSVTGEGTSKVINIGIPLGMPEDVGGTLVARAESAEASSAQSAADAQTALQAQFMTQDEGVAALIGTNAGLETQVALDDRDRGPKPPTGVPVSIRDSATDAPFWMGKDRRTLYRGGGTILKTSTNNGATWQQAGSFVFPTYTVGIRELDNGELLVATSASGGNPGALYLSSGGPAGTWTKVLTAGYSEAGVKVGPSSFFNGEWGMSVHENIAVVSEYGIQNLGVDQARYVYLSQDYGQTWTRIYDIGDFQQAHVHSAFYDPWWKAIWVSQGDATNRAVKYSLDMGATWITVANPLNSQMVGGIALPGCILFLSDFQPDGVYRVERTTNRMGTTLEFAYGIYNNQTDLRRYIGEMPYWTGRKGDPVLLPFISDVSWTGPAKLVTTNDGYTFNTVWTDTQSYQQAGLYRVLGPTVSGALVGELDDNRQAAKSLISFSYLPDTKLDPNAFASSDYYKGRPGAGSYTQGDVLTLGSFAFNTRADTGTSVVAGGANAGQENVVGGNTANVDTATSNLSGAPTLTGTNGNWNFLLAGYDTVINGWANVVHGFHSKMEVDANHNTFGGGSRQSATAGTSYGTIGGGTQNTISGVNATVAGGNGNQATGNGSTVGGGQTNTASASGSLVAGGVANSATDANATVAGGSTNTASGNSSTVLGGLTNTASATGSAVFAGRDNTASGPYSVASGRGAVAPEAHMQAHGSQPFAAPGDAQINRWVLKQATTNATAANLDANTGAPPVIPENTTWAFTALVAGRRTDVDGENAAWEVKGCFKRDVGNTAALVGTPTVTLLGASTGAAAWTVTVASYSVGTLRLVVTGEAGKTIRWVAELHGAQVQG
ncbi:hypothetical protein [Janibacter terrae]|uniref:hypothetical protein n=1 Tax=Janibacter terrae TaxID=103817 RepID=UPI0031F8380E